MPALHQGAWHFCAEVWIHFWKVQFAAGWAGRLCSWRSGGADFDERVMRPVFNKPGAMDDWTPRGGGVLSSHANCGHTWQLAFPQQRPKLGSPEAQAGSIGNGSRIYIESLTIRDWLPVLYSKGVFEIK